MVAVDSSALIPLAWVGRLNLISATFEEIQATPLVESKALVDGSGAVVASQRQSVPPAETVDGQRVVYEQVDLRVPGLSTGDTVTVELVPDVSNPRQEGLNYIDTVETILPGEFDAGTPAPLPGYDNTPRDLDGDGLFESVEEILRRLKVDSPRIVACTRRMCTFCG